MQNEHTKELINAAVDGALTDAELDQLESLLAESSEARDLKQDLERVLELIDKTPGVEPPRGLSQKILESVDLPARRTKFDWRGLWPQARPATYGLAFAAGLVMAVAFYELTPVLTTPQDLASLVGTMASNKQIDGIRQQETLSIDLEQIQGSVSLRTGAEVMMLEFNLDSIDAIEIRVGLEGSGLTFGGFASTESRSDSDIDTLRVSGGTLRVVNQGRQFFTMFLRESAGQQGDAAGINIELTHGGDRVYEGILDPRR
jgi:hypothetical protein